MSLFARLKSLLPGRHNAEQREIYLPVYTAIVAQSRQPALYGEQGAPDSFDGRFDVLVLHMYLVLRRLKHDGVSRHGAGQVLFDLFFRDMDQAMREMGVGDMGVGKKVKKMAEAVYGRVAAYDEALQSDAAQQEISEILQRNLFPEAITPETLGNAQRLAAYALALDEFLTSLPLAQILTREVFRQAPEAV